MRLFLSSSPPHSPLVLAIEDIHWADEGMLDLIEHLAGSGSGPVLFVCLARDELLDRRPSWGGGRRNATTISLDSLSADEAETLVGSLLAGDEPGWRSRGRVARPLGRQPAVRRGDGQPPPRGGERRASTSCPTASMPSLPPASTRSTAKSASCCRPPRSSARASGRRLVAELTRRGRSTALLAALVAKDLLDLSPSTRLSGVREFCFKHALVRDVAYATLPRAVRARRHSRSRASSKARRGANREGGSRRSSRSTTATAAALAEAVELPAEELRGSAVSAAARLRGGGRRGGVALLERRGPHPLRERAAHRGRARPRGAGARPGEPGDTAFRSGHVDAAIELVGGARLPGRRGEPRAGRRAAPQDRLGSLAQGRPGGLHRPLPAGHRPAQGRRSLPGADRALRGGGVASMSRRATTCSRSTRQRRPSGWPRRWASRPRPRRAHLTFGRVFGRIGDLDRARRSLERSVELARQAGPAEAMRALLALGRHLEVAEADYAAARRAAFSEALELADELGDVPAQIELHAALGQLAVHPARLAGGRRARRASRLASPSARASPASSPCRCCCRGSRPGGAATGTARKRTCSGRMGSLPREAGRRWRFPRCFGSPAADATAATPRPPAPCSRKRRRSASAPGSPRSPSRQSARASRSCRPPAGRRRRGRRPTPPRHCSPVRLIPVAARPPPPKFGA